MDPLDGATAVRSTLAGVATCATGRRVSPGELPPDALRRRRVDVLALLDVADPDDACARWWDAALAAAPVELFPRVLSGLLALRAQGTAIGAVTFQDRDRAIPRPGAPGLHAYQHLAAAPGLALLGHQLS
ncbi:hypothetical protein AB0N06_23045 [Streptomyces sp. NPDC051020]|uniref:hypothetical protein n=1 Tax=Streptomyces sp. NPDC051020 TaxID=3155409 RepID=UPI00343D6BD5